MANPEKSYKLVPNAHYGLAHPDKNVTFVTGGDDLYTTSVLAEQEALDLAGIRPETVKKAEVLNKAKE